MGQPVKQCYVCKNGVPESAATKLANWLDSLGEDVMEVVANDLGLVHCRGPVEQFLDDGRVVVCGGCLAPYRPRGKGAEVV
jgi:hypothetical protein